MSFFANVGDAVVDREADKLVNEFIPDSGGFLGGSVATGIDQVINNDINRHLGGGLGSEGYGGGGGGFF